MLRAISHSARHTKNTSSTDFCSRPSKKIAGAYSASISPATMPGARARTAARPASAEQRARRRPDDDLDDADEQQVAAGDGVDDAEQIGIQRRLVEHLAAEPVAAGDPLRPLVVAVRVAHQHREERRRADLPDVQEAHDERDREDRRRP